jgi:hypothetical protein
VAGKFDGCPPCPEVGDWLGAPAVVPEGVAPAAVPFCAVDAAGDVGHGTIGVFGFTGWAGPVGGGTGLVEFGGVCVAPGPAALVVIGVGGPMVEAGGAIWPEAPAVVGGAAGGGVAGRAWDNAQDAQHNNAKRNENRIVTISLRLEVVLIKFRSPHDGLLSG